MLLAREWNVKAKVYVSQLGEGTTKDDLREVFERYGKVADIWMYSNALASFAIIEFEDETNVEEAVRALGEFVKVSGAKAKLEMMAANSANNGGMFYGGPFSRGRGWARGQGPPFRGRGGGGRGRGDYYGSGGVAAEAVAVGDASSGFWRGGGVIEGTLDRDGDRASSSSSSRYQQRQHGHDGDKRERRRSGHSGHRR